MSGFVGCVNFKENLASKKDALISMNDSIKNRGPDESGYFTNDNILLGFKRLVIKDIDGGKQPMSFKYNSNTYVIVVDGYIYNIEELKNKLIENNISLESYSDVEVILKSYIFFREDIVNKLIGSFAFAIWDKNNKTLFMARDHLGVKPLYYTVFDNTLIFASEVKALLKYPGVEPILDEQGFCELFGIAPAHTSGITAFKNIYELKPAHYIIYDEYGICTKRYWKIKSKSHKDNLSQTCAKIRYLLEDSIKNQLVTDTPFCTFLSGGLDSSIITLYASEYCHTHNLPVLNTYSINYIDYDNNYPKASLQPSSDNYYIDLVQKKLHTDHHTIMLDPLQLAKSLESAMIARDFPGMADIDTSLLLFCKNVRPDATVAITGECADEIFGGYPWFFREDALKKETFPWSISINERQTLLNQKISKKINLKEYIYFRYRQSLSDIDFLDSDSFETTDKRKISHLALTWFMQTLLDRSERMGMYNGFEIRVPFSDYRLVEYVWNIPWEMKALNGREKGLLRYAMKDILPAEIIDKKKNPSSKTWSLTYLKTVKKMLDEIIADKNAPINNLLNRDYILQILETDGRAFTRPWFGQLMTGPQLMAYLCQVNMWLLKYNPKIEI